MVTSPPHHTSCCNGDTVTVTMARSSLASRRITCTSTAGVERSVDSARSTPRSGWATRAGVRACPSMRTSATTAVDVDVGPASVLMPSRTTSCPATSTTSPTAIGTVTCSPVAVPATARSNRAAPACASSAARRLRTNVRTLATRATVAAAPSAIAAGSRQPSAHSPIPAAAAAAATRSDGIRPRLTWTARPTRTIGASAPLKNPGAMARRSPPNHPRSTGYNVPTRTTARPAPSTTHAADLPRVGAPKPAAGRAAWRIDTTVATAAASASNVRARPMDRASAKAWTDDVAPERVSAEPSTASRNGSTTAALPHPDSLRRPMCSATVTASHGSRAAFSTGSHAQYPPHPSSAYAQCAPSTMPRPSNAHEQTSHGWMRDHRGRSSPIAGSPSASAAGTTRTVRPA